MIKFTAPTASALMDSKFGGKPYLYVEHPVKGEVLVDIVGSISDEQIDNLRVLDRGDMVLVSGKGTHRTTSKGQPIFKAASIVPAGQNDPDDFEPVDFELDIDFLPYEGPSVDA